MIIGRLHSQSDKIDLISQPLDTLFNLYHKEKDIVLKKRYLETLLIKAKQENDTTSIAEGYNLYSLLYKNENNGIIYSDSLIQLTQNTPNKLYPANAYLLKGDQYFYVKNDLKQALDNYLLARQYAKENFNKFTLVGSNHMIGIIKDKIGYSKEALKIHLKNLKLIEKEFQGRGKDYFLGTSLQAVSFTYKNLGKMDSALYYNKKGVILANKMNNEPLKNHLLLNEGVIYFHQLEFQKSESSLKNVISYFKEKQDEANLAEAFFYLAKTYKALGKDEQSINYLKQVDSVFLKTGRLSPDIRESYEILISYYESNNKPEEQLLYLKRLISLDSLLSSDQNDLAKSIRDNYDIPKLISQKKILIDNLERKQLISTYIYVSLALVLLIVIYVFYSRTKKLKKKFQDVMSTNFENNEIREPTVKKTINNKKEENFEVPINIAEDILIRLELFIKKEKFKDKKLTLSSLSKFCNTNSTYLSKTINHYYDKSYTNYINDLRVKYAMIKLKEDSSFRNYTIKAIAYESGFKSAETFSKTFKKNYDIYPSYFIKQLNNTKQII